MNRQDLQNKLSDLQRKVEKIKNDFPKQDFRISYFEIEKIREEINKTSNEMNMYETAYKQNLHQFKQNYSNQLNQLYDDLNSLINQQDKFCEKSIWDKCISFGQIILSFLPFIFILSAVILYVYLCELGLVNIFTLIVYDVSYIPFVVFFILYLSFFVFFYFGLYEVLFSWLNDDKYNAYSLGMGFLLLSIMVFFIYTFYHGIDILFVILFVILLCISITYMKFRLFKQKREYEFKEVDFFSLIIIFFSVFVVMIYQPKSIFELVRITEKEDKTFKLNTNFSKNLSEDEKKNLFEIFKSSNTNQSEPTGNYLRGRLIIKTKSIHILCPVDKVKELEKKESKKNQPIGKFCYQFSAGGALGDDLIDVTAIHEKTENQSEVKK